MSPVCGIFFTRFRNCKLLNTFILWFCRQGIVCFQKVQNMPVFRWSPFWNLNFGKPKIHVLSNFCYFWNMIWKDVSFPYHTCLASFYLAREMSLLLGTVQNQNLHSRGPKYGGRLGHSASLALCNQENTLDIAEDTLPRLVSIFQERECVTKTLQTPPISWDPQTGVLMILLLWNK